MVSWNITRWLHETSHWLITSIHFLFLSPSPASPSLSLSLSLSPSSFLRLSPLTLHRPFSYKEIQLMDKKYTLWSHRTSQNWQDITWCLSTTALADHWPTFQTRLHLTSMIERITNFHLVLFVSQQTNLLIFLVWSPDHYHIVNEQ